MARKQPTAGVPKIDGFERVKYQGMALTGLPARVFAAYFGKPKRIIDAFNTLYGRGKEKPSNTGRISNVTSQLVGANYLDLYQTEGSNWPLLCSNLQPLYELFAAKKVRLNEADRKELEKALIPNHDSAERFGISEDEAFGVVEFMPSPLKMQSYLNSSASMALVSLFKQAQPEFKEERELLKRIKQKTYGAASEEQETGEADLSTIPAFSDDLALKTKVLVKEGEDLENVLLFKILKLTHEPDAYKALLQEVGELFE